MNEEITVSESAGHPEYISTGANSPASMINETPYETNTHNLITGKSYDICMYLLLDVFMSESDMETNLYIFMRCFATFVEKSYKIASMIRRKCHEIGGGMT